MDESSFDRPPPGLPASLVEALEALISAYPPPDPLGRELLELRSLAAEQEEMVAEAQQAIEKLEAIVRKVTAPANRIGTFLGRADDGNGANRGRRSGLLLQPRSARSIFARFGAALGCWSTRLMSSSAISATTRRARW